MSKPILTTERLELRCFTLADDAFILELLTEPGWLRYIGDKGVRTLEDARNYLAGGILAHYARHGFGLWRVALRAGDVPIGMCGLIRRATLPDVDIGFALLARYSGQGYALEAARATLAHARELLGIPRVIAITAPDNLRSGRLLEKLGLECAGLVELEGDARESKLFAPRAAAGPERVR